MDRSAYELIGKTAMGAMDEMQNGGRLDKEGATFRAVAVIVAVDHGDQSTVDYRFRAADGSELDKATGQEMLKLVQQAIG